MYSRILAFVMVVGAAVGLAGCSSDATGVAVSGTVTYEGEPLEDGSIALIPAAGTNGPTAGATISAGKFSIPAAGGPVPGTYRVEISSFKESKTPKGQAGAQMFGRPVGDFPAGADQQLVVKSNIIPAKFNDNSQLTAEIPAAASHELTFALNK